MQRVEHQNIVKFYESIETAKFVYIVMEHLPGVSLLSHIKSQHNRQLPEPQAKVLW